MRKVTVVLIYVSYFVFLLFSVGRISSRVGDLSVEVLDVGQGDAILITTPRGRKVLVDGGAGFEVDSYLDKKMPFGVCTLDVVVLTHPHRDHLEGLNRVLERCFVGIVLTNTVDYDSYLYEEWRLLTKGFTVRKALLGDSFFLDGVYFKVLWPTKEYVKDFNDNVNNVSVVLFMDYGDFEAVFTGDAEKEVLKSIDVASFWDYVDGSLDVYKVAHHGAVNATHKGFMEAIEPLYCAISAGAGNKFGHPHEDALGILQDTCGEIYRTDMDGTIKFVYNQ